MGLIVEEHEGIETVGELVSALQKFPANWLWRVMNFFAASESCCTSAALAL